MLEAIASAQAVGDTPSITDRVDAMYAMYQTGASLREVGAVYGISGERVRQLFAAAELATRSRAEANVRRKAEIPAAQSEQTRQRKSRTGRRHAWAKKKFTDGELISCLQGASQVVGGVLSTTAYAHFAKTRRFPDGRQWPTHQTHFHRFGSWRNALRAAGLRANPSSAIAGQRLFEVGHCIDAIRHVYRELDRIPSVNDYERIATASNGALPSSATIRNRCGTWADALRMADL